MFSLSCRLISLSVLLILQLSTIGQTNGGNQFTICNPMDLSYRYCLDTPSRREAADPTMVVFKDEYYLFASKSGGYFHSTDLIRWDLITTNDLPIEDYAPTAMVMKDTLYFMASGAAPKIYKTTDPKSGNWTVVNESFPIGMIDPDLFVDDDGRLFFYYGCSNIDPLHAVELDPVSFNPIGKPVDLLNSNKKLHGWERKSDYNDQAVDPWIEGAWMTKYNGKYYLQYAAPGTEFKSYSDGVYVSDKPLGPYTMAKHNPVAYKPEGFVAGAGHGNTFRDRYGNYWHIATMTISNKHMFERRLGLFPAFFDKDGTFYIYTGFGDMPIRLPSKKINGPDEISTGWMLLSYNKQVQASSELPEHPKQDAVDEEIRSFWSARTGEKGEWFSIDLGKSAEVNAVQINYYEYKSDLLGRKPGIYYQYLLEYSDDNKTWKTMVDKTSNTEDRPHDYIELGKPVKARYIRITNYRVPDGTFTLSGIRVFGKANGSRPAQVNKIDVSRNAADRCQAVIKWPAVPGATGYNIRYGTDRNKLYHNYQVLGVNDLKLNSLDSNEKYFFTVDAFNESGVTRGSAIKAVE
ncbi:family 43 glycosylhydrolase [Pollutibacter soli]|uniref:family 43 glycosylhydrolase n=1 Tax=Pollutibacter soli TaxID=3034157 RepID=UPI003014095C